MSEISSMQFPDLCDAIKATSVLPTVLADVVAARMILEDRLTGTEFVLEADVSVWNGGNVGGDGMGDGAGPSSPSAVLEDVTGATQGGQGARGVFQGEDGVDRFNASILRKRERGIARQVWVLDQNSAWRHVEVVDPSSGEASTPIWADYDENGGDPPAEADLYAQADDGSVYPVRRQGGDEDGVGPVQEWELGAAATACSAAAREIDALSKSREGGHDTLPLMLHRRKLMALKLDVVAAADDDARTWVMIGESHAGKSALINEILEEDVLPTMEDVNTSTTFARTTIVYHPDAYTVSIKLVEEEALESEVWAFARSGGSTPDSRTGSAWSEPTCRVAQLFADAAGIEYVNLIIDAHKKNVDAGNGEEGRDVGTPSSSSSSLPEPSRHSPASMSAMSRAFGRTLAYRKLSALRNRLQLQDGVVYEGEEVPVLADLVEELVHNVDDEEEDAHDESAIVTLIIRGINLAGPFPILKTGARLIDLPGLNDANTARREDAMRVLGESKCRAVYVNKGGDCHTDGLEDLLDKVVRANFVSITVVVTSFDAGYAPMVGKLRRHARKNKASPFAKEEAYKRLAVVAHQAKLIAQVRGKFISKLEGVNIELGRAPLSTPSISFLTVDSSGGAAEDAFTGLESMRRLIRHTVESVNAASASLISDTKSCIATIASLLDPETATVNNTIEPTEAHTRAATAIVDHQDSQTSAALEAITEFQARAEALVHDARNARVPNVRLPSAHASVIWASVSRTGAYDGFRVNDAVASQVMPLFNPSANLRSLLDDLKSTVVEQRRAVRTAIRATIRATSQSAGDEPGLDAEIEAMIRTSNYELFTESSRITSILSRLDRRVSEVMPEYRVRESIRTHLNPSYQNADGFWGLGTGDYCGDVKRELQSGIPGAVRSVLEVEAIRRCDLIVTAINDILDCIGQFPAIASNAVAVPTLSGPKSKAATLAYSLSASALKRVMALIDGIPDLSHVAPDIYGGLDDGSHGLDSNLALEQFEDDHEELTCKICYHLLADPVPLGSPSVGRHYFYCGLCVARLGFVDRAETIVLDPFTQTNVEKDAVVLEDGEEDLAEVIDALLVTPRGRAWLASDLSAEYRNKRGSPLPTSPTERIILPSLEAALDVSVSALTHVLQKSLGDREELDVHFVHDLYEALLDYVDRCVTLASESAHASSSRTASTRELTETYMYVVICSNFDVISTLADGRKPPSNSSGSNWLTALRTFCRTRSAEAFFPITRN